MERRLNKWGNSNLVRICAVSGLPVRKVGSGLHKQLTVMTTLFVSGTISRSGPKESFFLKALQKLNRVHISASSKQRLLLEVECPSRKESYSSPDNPSRFP